MKTFAEHLTELKRRLLVYLLFLGAGSIVGFMMHKPVESILQKPLGQTLYYTNPTGGLSFVMQIALCVGVLLSLPVLLYQLVQFARPAIKPVKSQVLFALIACSLLLTGLGIGYAYYISLPAALKFLVTFNGPDIKALISIDDYMKFLFAYILGTVLAFQIPLILYFTNKIRRFPPGGLLKLQRPAIIGAIVFAGIITPTVDPINQMFVAAPIILLFEIGALSVVISNRVNKPRPVFEIRRPSAYVPLVVPIETITKPQINSLPPLVTNPRSAVQKVATEVTQQRNQHRRVIVMDIVNPMTTRPVHG